MAVMLSCNCHSDNRNITLQTELWLGVVNRFCGALHEFDYFSIHDSNLKTLQLEVF